MGLSNKTEKSSGTSTQDINQSTTPTNPAWVDSGLADFGKSLGNLAGTDPRSFVAQANPLLGQAGTAAGDLSNTPWAYDGASDISRGIAQGATPDIASLMGAFKGAFDNRVINPALAGFDQQATLTNAQDHLNLGRDTTFGGSGAAITDALTRGQQGLARGQLQGGLLSDQFKTALSGAQSQAQTELAARQQRLGAAGQIANIADEYGGNSRSNATTQAGIGGQLQGIDQATSGAPLSTAALIASLWGGLPLGLTHGSNTTGTVNGTTTGSSSSSGATLGDWLNFIASNAKAAASMGGG